MNRKHTTRRALLGSVTSLLLCFAMLIGSTFAWFTDTATTSVNTIQAGTLDVQLLDKDGDTLEGKTLNWQKADSGKGEEVLWEPGCTYSLQPITIKNDGNLALKYKIAITGINGSAKLNKVIDWTIQVDGKDYAADSEFHLTANDSDTLTIKGHMQESAGNGYQGEKIDGIAITVYATQDTVEYDSTTKDYDKNAEYLIPWDGTTENVPTADANGVITLKTPGQFVSYITAVNDGYSADSYRLNDVVLDCDVDLGGYEFEVSGEGYSFEGSFDGQGHTVSNFTITRTDGELYTGLFSVYLNSWKGASPASVKNLTVKNATINSNGGQVAAVVPSVNEYCTVENCHAINCTVIGEKKVAAVVGYVSVGTVKDCYAENCSVYCADTRTEQAAEIVGYINTDSTVESNTFDNVTVYTGVKATAVSNAAELKTALTNGGYIVLTKDIDLKNDSWTAPTLTKDLVLDGNGHTIANLSVSGVKPALIQRTTKNLTVKNLTMKDAVVTAVNEDSLNASAAVILAYPYMDDNALTFDNVSIVGAKVSGKYVGGLVGYVEEVNPSKAVTVNNCSVSGSEFIGTGSVGALVGGLTQGNVVIDSVTVTNNTITGDRAASALIGYAAGASVTATNATASGNNYTANSQKYTFSDMTFGYSYKTDAGSYSINGTAK